jgi:hypothetical protein
MNATELATLSMRELKSMCAANSLEVRGDRRSKAAYILAIESFQSQQTVIDIESLPAMPDPFEDSYEFVMSSETVNQSEVPDVLSVIDKSDNATTLPQPTPQPLAPQLTPQPPTPQQPTLTPLAIQPTSQYRGASLVVLITLLLVTVAVISLRIGASVLILIIAAVGRLSVAVWQSSITGNEIGTESIPKGFPFPA